MIMKCYSVRDSKVEAFLPVFMCRAVGEAIRSFTAAVQSVDHQFAKNKDDYVLYFVGDFDDVAGMFIPAEPVRLLSAIEASVDTGK